MYVCWNAGFASVIEFTNCFILIIDAGGSIVDLLFFYFFSEIFEE